MPIRLSDLAKDRRTINIPVGTGTVRITYRPGGLTPEVEDQLRAYAADQRGGAALVALLASCLVDWDVEDEDGQPLPVTAERLRQLPTVFLAQVAQAITEDLRPNPPNAGSFADG